MEQEKQGKGGKRFISKKRALVATTVFGAVAALGYSISYTLAKVEMDEIDGLVTASLPTELAKCVEQEVGNDRNMLAIKMANETFIGVVSLGKIEAEDSKTEAEQEELARKIRAATNSCKGQLGYPRWNWPL